MSSYSSYKNQYHSYAPEKVEGYYYNKYYYPEDDEAEALNKPVFYAKQEFLKRRHDERERAAKETRFKDKKNKMRKITF